MITIANRLEKKLDCFFFYTQMRNVQINLFSKTKIDYHKCKVDLEMLPGVKRNEVKSNYASKKILLIQLDRNLRFFTIFIRYTFGRQDG